MSNRHHDPTRQEFWELPMTLEFPELFELFKVVVRILLSNKWKRREYKHWAPDARKTLLVVRSNMTNTSAVSADAVMDLLSEDHPEIERAALVALRYPKGYKRESTPGLPPRARVQWELLSPEVKYSERPSE